jgi:predicted flap endonuclease-1-like 5' DNA nuclease
MLPSIILNIIILVYLLRPGVEKVFAPAVQPGAAAGAPAPAAVPAAMPVEERMAPIPETVLAEEVEPVEAVEPVMAEAPVVPVAVAAVMAGEMEDAEAPAEPEAAVIAEAPAVAVAAMAAEPEEVVMPEPQMEPEAAAAVTMATEPEVAAPVEEKAVEVPAHAARPKVPIDTIEGIGPVYKAKLKELGIETVANLLELGASRKGREELAANSAISEALVLKWVNMADLMRISGVGEEYSELLEAAGVDTVKELRNRNPENLLKAMLEANQQHAMVRRTPHLSEVESWVAQAKLLDPVITY